MSAEARILAEVFDYAGLIAALRARAADRMISLSSEQNHALAGLPDRYMAKLLAPLCKRSRRLPNINRRHLGHRSMGPILALLGVKLVVVADEEAIAKYGPRLEYMAPNSMRSGTVHFEISLRELRRRQRLGGLNSRKNLTITERQRLARIAARARWQKQETK